MTILKIVAIIIALMLSVTLCACSTQEESQIIPIASTSKSESFIVVAESSVGSYFEQTIMYDPKVELIFSSFGSIL